MSQQVFPLRTKFSQSYKTRVKPQLWVPTCICSILYRQSKSEPWDPVENAGSSSRTLPVAVIFKVQHFLATTLCANQSFEGRPSNLLVYINKTNQESWHIPSTQYSQLNKTSQLHGTARRRTLPTIGQYFPHNYPLNIRFLYPWNIHVSDSEDMLIQWW